MGSMIRCLNCMQEYEAEERTGNESEKQTEGEAEEKGDGQLKERSVAENAAKLIN